LLYLISRKPGPPALIIDIIVAIRPPDGERIGNDMSAVARNDVDAILLAFFELIDDRHIGLSKCIKIIDTNIELVFLITADKNSLVNDLTENGRIRDYVRSRVQLIQYSPVSRGGLRCFDDLIVKADRKCRQSNGIDAPVAITGCYVKRCFLLCKRAC